MKKYTGLICIIILLIGSAACNTQSVPTTGSVPVTETATPELSVSPTPHSLPTPESVLAPTVSPETTITPITDFDHVAVVFESKELGITVDYPFGWTVKQDLQSDSIAVVDNWTAFISGDANADAIGILILSMPDSSESVKKTLENLVPKMKNIDKQIGDIVLEERDGQEFAWGEYSAKSLGDNAPVHYFLTAISSSKRHATVFASVNADRQEKVRSIYQAIVEKNQATLNVAQPGVQPDEAVNGWPAAQRINGWALSGVVLHQRIAPRVAFTTFMVQSSSGGPHGRQVRNQKGWQRSVPVQSQSRKRGSHFDQRILSNQGQRPGRHCGGQETCRQRRQL